MQCPICNQEMVCMTPQHIKKHSLTMQEYRAKYKGNEFNTNIHKKIERNKYRKLWIESQKG